MAADWRIEEYDDIAIPEDDLTATDVEYIRTNVADEIAIEPPWAGTKNHWVLYNNGYIGHIQLPSGAAIELVPGIDLDDVFGMLEYAYDLAEFQLEEELYESATVSRFYDKVANILAQNVNKRRKQGLYRSYRTNEERSERVRGRIDFAGTLQKPWDQKPKISYRELSANNEDNQILLYTLSRVSRSGFPREETLRRTRRAIRSLRDAIEYREFEASDCIGRRYNRLNSDYERMHALCRLLLENSRPSQEIGDAQMIPYRVRTFDLYEQFVHRWLNENLPAPYSVQFKEAPALGSTGLNFEIDNIITGRGGEQLCVLDTKYRAPDNRKPDPAEISQVLAYAKRMDVEHAFLVYPKEVGKGEGFPLTLGDVEIHTVQFAIEGDLESNGQQFLDDVATAIGVADLTS